LLENPGSGVPSLLDHAGDVAGLLEQLDRDAFGINYDVGNLLSHCSEREPLSDARAAMSIADHFPLKPCTRTPVGINFVPFGKRDVDDSEVATELLRQGKPFSLKLPFRLHRDAGAQPWRDENPMSLEMIESCVSRSLEKLDFLAENA
jgi:hypothetical protein